MAVLLLSHASKDDAEASALEAWLRANGFTEIFVDHHSIAGGDKWREVLRASAGSCRVILCLVTGHWLASYECFNEFRAAWYMGKRIIPLFLLPSTADLSEESKKRFAEVCSEDQGLDLIACLGPDGALNLDANQDILTRLETGLRAAAPSPGGSTRKLSRCRNLRPTPFPGLASFGHDDADAALFYGRAGRSPTLWKKFGKCALSGTASVRHFRRFWCWEILASQSGRHSAPAP